MHVEAPLRCRIAARCALQLSAHGKGTSASQLELFNGESAQYNVNMRRIVKRLIKFENVPRYKHATHKIQQTTCAVQLAAHITHRAPAAAAHVHPYQHQAGTIPTRPAQELQWCAPAACARA